MIVKIRENETGQIVEMTDKNDSTFIWEEGNFSCDCNRALLFGRERGVDEDIDYECSEGKYSIQLLSDSGEMLYSEF